MIRAHVLTLNGSAQSLSTLSDALPYSIRTISLQPGGANAAPIYVGDAITTPSASSHGVRLEAATATIPPAPFVLGEFAPGWCTLADFRVIGANTEKLHILVDYHV
jgi:hypothetical protein